MEYLRVSAESGEISGSRSDCLSHLAGAESAPCIVGFWVGWLGYPGYKVTGASPASSSQVQWMVLAQTWAAGVGIPGSPLPHLSQSQSQSQTDAPAEEEAGPSGLAAVAAAHAGIGQMMTGDLSPLALEVEGLTLVGSEDLSPGALV